MLLLFFWVLKVLQPIFVNFSILLHVMCITQALCLVFIIIRVMHTTCKSQSFINSRPTHLRRASRPLFREKVGTTTWRSSISSFITKSKHRQITFIVDIKLHSISILNFPNFLIELDIIIVIKVHRKSGPNHFLSGGDHLLFAATFHEEIIDKTKKNCSDHQSFLQNLIDSWVSFILW